MESFDRPGPPEPLRRRMGEMERASFAELVRGSVLRGRFGLLEHDRVRRGGCGEARLLSFGDEKCLKAGDLNVLSSIECAGLKWLLLRFESLSLISCCFTHLPWFSSDRIDSLRRSSDKDRRGILARSRLALFVLDLGAADGALAASLLMSGLAVFLLGKRRAV